MPLRKHTVEMLLEARRLYQTGLPLTKVAIEVKIPYHTLHYHAWVQGWAQPQGNGKAKIAGVVRRKLEQEEHRLKEQLAISKAQDVEVLARKASESVSARTRAAIGYQVGKLLKELSEEKGLSVKEKCQALNALSSVVKVLHGIETESGELREARGAINLALINTSPEQLRALSDKVKE